MKMLSLRSVYVVLYYMGVFRIFYFLNRKCQVVITWHNVISDNFYNNNLLHLGVSCSESSFIKQVDVITSRFLTTTDLGVQKSCMITFDDGYKNNIEIAASYLNKKKISGLFFIPASYFCDNLRDNILWVDKILMWLSYVPEGTYFVFGAKYEISTVEQSRREIWAWCYKNILANYSIVASLVAELDNQFLFEKIVKLIPDNLYRSRFEVMNLDELNQLKEMGHKLACHSYKHDILSLLDEEKLEHDFSICSMYSKEYNINYYSYPFGGEDEISEHVLNACKRHGYLAGFVNYKNHNADLYSLGRISLDNLVDKYCIEARLCGLEFFLKNLREKLNIILIKIKPPSSGGMND